MSTQNFFNRIVRDIGLIEIISGSWEIFPRLNFNVSFQLLIRIIIIKVIIISIDIFNGSTLRFKDISISIVQFVALYFRDEQLILYSLHCKVGYWVYDVLGVRRADYRDWPIIMHGVSQRGSYNSTTNLVKEKIWGYACMP